jgi:hypothetical protein
VSPESTKLVAVVVVIAMVLAGGATVFSILLG